MDLFNQDVNAEVPEEVDDFAVDFSKADAPTAGDYRGVVKSATYKRSKVKDLGGGRKGGNDPMIGLGWEIVVADDPDQVGRTGYENLMLVGARFRITKQAIVAILGHEPLKGTTALQLCGLLQGQEFNFHCEQEDVEGRGVQARITEWYPNN